MVSALRLNQRLQFAFEPGDFAGVEWSDSTEAKLSKVRGHDRAAMRGHLFPPVVQRGQERGQLALGEHIVEYSPGVSYLTDHGEPFAVTCA